MDSWTDEKQANKLQKRVDRRQDRQLILEAREVDQSKIDAFENKTTEIQTRKDKAQLDSDNAASSEMAKIKAENERLKKKYEA